VFGLFVCVFLSLSLSFSRARALHKYKTPEDVGGDVICEMRTVDGRAAKN